MANARVSYESCQRAYTAPSGGKQQFTLPRFPPTQVLQSIAIRASLLWPFDCHCRRQIQTYLHGTVGNEPKTANHPLLRLSGGRRLLLSCVPDRRQKCCRGTQV